MVLRECRKGNQIQTIYQAKEKLIQIIHQRNKNDVNCCLCIHQKEAKKLGRDQKNFVSSEFEVWNINRCAQFQLTCGDSRVGCVPTCNVILCHAQPPAF